MKTTPINALLVVCNETPLDLRWNKLSLAYWLRLHDEKHFASSVIKKCWEYERHVGEGFGWNLRKLKNVV